MAKNNMKLELLLNEYVRLQKKSEEIEVLKLEMKTEVKKALNQMGATTFGNDKGRFNIYPIKNWKFSKKVVALEEEVETLKEKEKESGVAKATITESLRFTIKK